jgi:hypothetical protein
MFSRDNYATQYVNKDSSNTSVISSVNYSGTQTIEADIDSMDSDGFTLDFSATTNGVKIMYIALGDEDVASGAGGARQGLHAIEQGAV